MDDDLIAKIKKLLEEDDPRITVDEYIIPSEIDANEWETPPEYAY